MCSLCGGTEGAWVPAVIAIAAVSVHRFKGSIIRIKNKIIKK